MKLYANFNQHQKLQNQKKMLPSITCFGKEREREDRLTSIIENLMKKHSDYPVIGSGASSIEEVEVEASSTSQSRPNINNINMLSASGDTTTTSASTNGTEDSSPQSHSHLKSRKRRIPDRMNSNCANDYISHHIHNNNNNNNNSISNNNNNNTVKNERLSPGTPDTLSRSRSVTPSSASYPGTPPSSGEVLPPTTTTGLGVGGHPHGLMPLTGRNYSDFMRSLAAKYNNTNPNDYRNGFASFKGHSGVAPSSNPCGKDEAASPSPSHLALASSPSPSPKKHEYPPSSLAAAAALLNPFASPVFPPLIDMSTTQTLLAMVRTAKEAEIQGLLKTASNSSPIQQVQQNTILNMNTNSNSNTSSHIHSNSNSSSNKRSHNQLQSSLSELSSPLDLSAAGTPIKRARVKTPNSSKTSNSDSESPKPMHHPNQHLNHQHQHHHDPIAIDDISSWSVEDVCNFVSSIDICSEYAQKFREQRIDGAGLPLLTEEHLTSTIQMKLGPALKLRSMLAKKLGSCTICLHCVHCHSSPTNTPPPSLPSQPNSNSNNNNSNNTNNDLGSL